METGCGEKGMRKAAAQRIAVVVVWVLLAEWVFPLVFGRHPWSFAVLIAAILVYGFSCHHALHEGAPELGLRFDNFYYAAGLLALPMSVFIVLLTVIGYGYGSLGVSRLSAGWDGIRTFLWLVWWGLLQQYALQAIINRQAQVIWGKGARSILAVALIFAALHMPNLPLALATFGGGLVWASVYQRAPNLPALALSHGIMTVALVWALPPPLLHGLRVGIGVMR
jgi:membrane protease YdiL (CAAX protease family)